MLTSPLIPQDEVDPQPRILYLALCNPDLPVTGATVRMGAMIRYLGAHFDLTLVNLSGSGHGVDSALEAHYRQRMALPVSTRVQIPFSQARYFLFSPALYSAARELLAQRHYDYLWLDYGLAAVYGNLLAKSHGIPVIYSSHNVEYQLYLDQCRQDPRRLALAPYVYWAERAICRLAALVVVISEPDRKRYTQWRSRDRTLVIPQGFDPAECHPFYAPAPGPPTVLFVGSFKDENNRRAARDIVQRIAPQVALAVPEVRFVLIGSDPPPDLVGANIDCLGFVEDLAPYFRQAHLLIAPMAFSHGMSTKVVQGLAFGKPVLTTPQVAATLPGRYRQLHVASLVDFATHIVEILQHSPPVDASQFDHLCEQFGWPNLMEQLRQRILRCKAG